MKYYDLFKKIFIPLSAIIGLCLVVVFVLFSEYYREMQNSIDLKSRFTYKVNIDGDGNVISDESGKGKTAKGDISQLSLETVASVWVEEFTGQFSQKYISYSRALRNVKIVEINVIDREDNIVYVEFSVEQKNQESDYFSSWQGVTDKGKLVCEWVIQFSVDSISNNLAEVYATSIQSSEAYGLETYNANLKNDNQSSEKETKTEKELYIYEIKNQVLTVSYDGGEKAVDVPVDFENLMSGQPDKTKLSSGSYTIGLEKTTFLYGGTTVNNKKIPLTIIFSDNKGVDWISAEISDITGVNHYYVNFTDQKNGVIVIGYDKTAEQESSVIYVTSDGGENWERFGSGPTTNIIKDVNFIDDKIGFFAYEYMEGMDSNLYMTRDGGKTFSKITLEPQTLDSSSNKNNTSQTGSADITTSATGISKTLWNDVFKEAMVPTQDANGVLILYVTQGKNGIYNGGNTVAKYQSSDNGITWKYIEQVERKTK